MKLTHFLSFTVGIYTCVMRASEIERVVRVVSLLPLPQADLVVLGMINIHGKLSTVFDLRRLFISENRPSKLSDHIVMTHKEGKNKGFLVESILGISKREESDLVPLEEILPSYSNYIGMSAFRDGAIFLTDPENCLSQWQNQKSKTQSFR